jgi:hypothetical protein
MRAVMRLAGPCLAAVWLGALVVGCGRAHSQEWSVRASSEPGARRIPHDRAARASCSKSPMSSLASRSLARASSPTPVAPTTVSALGCTRASMACARRTRYRRRLHRLGHGLHPARWRARSIRRRPRLLPARLDPISPTTSVAGFPACGLFSGTRVLHREPPGVDAALRDRSADRVGFRWATSPRCGVAALQRARLGLEALRRDVHASIAIF